MNDKFELALHYKADERQLDKLRDYMGSFAKFEHIKSLQDQVLPPIANFTELIEKYTQDNEDMRTCVRKFDEDLSLKANKAQIYTMYEELEQQFMTLVNWEQIHRGL